MTEYELKWLSFVEETKNSDTENLNEYISDIINTAKTIADRAKGQGPDSPLSGLGRAATNYKKGEKEKEEEEEEVVAKPPAAEPKPAHDYYFPNPEKVQDTQEYKKLKKEHIRKYKGVAKFEEDLKAFLQIIGPFKSEQLYTRESSRDNIAQKIDKLASDSFLLHRKEEVSAALKKLPDDHGAIRIIRSMGNKVPKIMRISSIIVGNIDRQPKTTE